MSNTTVKNTVLFQRTSKSQSEDYTPVPGKLQFLTEACDEGVLLSVEVPGVDPESIQMDAYSDAIRIECERGVLEYPVEASLDLSKVDVSIRWGLLEISIPRRQSRPLKIKINEK
jgi:HSP20 family molecular chaperone IbpA